MPGLGLGVGVGQRRGRLSGGGEVQYGIEAMPSLSNGAADSAEVGWRFTVGAASLTVSALRVYPPFTGSIAVNLWRASDQAKIATVTIATTANTWAEGAIAPVVLAAGADYLVSMSKSSQGHKLGSIGGFTFNDAITSLGARYSSTSGNFPGSGGVSNQIYGITDIVFTV